MRIMSDSHFVIVFFMFVSSQRSQFSYELVPTLEEAVRECLDLKLRIFFDVKAYSKQVCHHCLTAIILP